jgi:hypothetical protein
VADRADRTDMLRNRGLRGYGEWRKRVTGACACPCLRLPEREREASVAAAPFPVPTGQRQFDWSVSWAAGAFGWCHGGTSRCSSLGFGGALVGPARRGEGICLAPSHCLAHPAVYTRASRSVLLLELCYQYQMLRTGQNS